MDTELAGRLMHLSRGLARIDERTIAIHDNQEKLAEALLRHEVENRGDFKEVHGRVNRVDRKQNWMLGVGSAVVAIFVGAFKGMFGG